VTQFIPLNKLLPSKRNVRRQGDAAADAELKADIEARGLLQNLIVTALRKPRGSFAVEGGGRRLNALKTLAAEDKIAKDLPVACLVLDDIGTNAAEASLAENFQRLALNPADECLAFQHFTEQGSDLEAVARRFGLTVRFVEGRLRLAGLAPVVFEALGRGDITLDIAKAYATTPDQERQAYVFEQMASSYNSAHPDSIRRMMTQATVSAVDPRARFVGETAYVEAGGRIERDLFADDTSTRWLDIALLERLASEKLDAAATAVAAEAGLAWVRPLLDHFVGWQQTEGLQRVSIETPPLTDAEESRSPSCRRRQLTILLSLKTRRARTSSGQPPRPSSNVLRLRLRRSPTSHR
jgi:ParB family chromosome partitioning protein